ncbi:hypothetical protein BC835DRAFT_1414799 [Cytidiella melzeri]|nr:hypothetical protein BC835DRAFT_1414799 [Cytidiella melzeri]
MLIPQHTFIAPGYCFASVLVASHFHYPSTSFAIMQFSTFLQVVLFATIVISTLHTVTVSAIPYGSYPTYSRSRNNWERQITDKHNFQHSPDLFHEADRFAKRVPLVEGPLRPEMPLSRHRGQFYEFTKVSAAASRGETGPREGASEAERAAWRRRQRLGKSKPDRRTTAFGRFWKWMTGTT